MGWQHLAPWRAQGMDVLFKAVIPAGLPRCHMRKGPAAVTAGVTLCPPGVLLAGAVTGMVSDGR